MVFETSARKMAAAPTSPLPTPLLNQWGFALTPFTHGQTGSCGYALHLIGCTPYVLDKTSWKHVLPRPLSQSDVQTSINVYSPAPPYAEAVRWGATPATIIPPDHAQNTFFLAPRPLARDGLLAHPDVLRCVIMRYEGALDHANKNMEQVVASYEKKIRVVCTQNEPLPALQ